LENKQKYVAHYINLQQAIKNGLIITKIHRALQFSQSKWLKPYIDFNTNLRTNAKNDFEKDQFKLYNNSVFGKTMENIRNRINIELVCDWKRAKKLIAKSNFHSSIIFTENLVSIHMLKTSLEFNKPIYVGMSILDLSKTLMYDFHYDIMVPKFNQDLQLMYMDTDSFVYQIHTEDLFAEYFKMAQHMDTSDYPKDHPNYSTSNKKVLGKFKDEVNGQIISRFVALRSKMYAIDVDGKIKKRAKGVQRATLSNQIGFHDYMRVLREQINIISEMRRIQSREHQVSTVLMRKKSLDWFDDKRHILTDGISTLPHGHYLL
jgi:hypothetical protein